MLCAASSDDCGLVLREEFDRDVGDHVQTTTDNGIYRRGSDRSGTEGHVSSAPGSSTPSSTYEIQITLGVSVLQVEIALGEVPVRVELDDVGQLRLRRPHHAAHHLKSSPIMAAYQEVPS